MIQTNELEKLIVSDKHSKAAFEQMLERIKTASTLDINPELNRLITDHDLHKIYQYFLDNDSLQTGTFLNELKALNPGEGYYLDKAHSGLARTVTILLSLEGEYKVILETKSKIADGSKQLFFKPYGADKHGGPSWRIDGEVKKYFNAVVKKEYLNGVPQGVPDYIAEKFGEIKEEAELSHQFNSKTINITDLGPIHCKVTKKEYPNSPDTPAREEFHFKVSVYSEHSHGNLRELLYDLYDNKVTLSEQQINIMILDLILAIKELHDNNYVHQDIKPENILVFKDDENNYRLKLTDLGVTRKHKDAQASSANGTKYYESPEILMNLLEPDTLRRYDHFAYAQAFKNYEAISDEKKQTYKRPHKANDLWCLGTVIWEMKFQQHHPKSLSFLTKLLIYRDPLLSYLFSDRKSRIDIDQALEIHQREMEDYERLVESCYTIMF